MIINAISMLHLIFQATLCITTDWPDNGTNCWLWTSLSDREAILYSKVGPEKTHLLHFQSCKYLPHSLNELAILFWQFH